MKHNEKRNLEAAVYSKYENVIHAGRIRSQTTFNFELQENLQLMFAINILIHKFCNVGTSLTASFLGRPA